MFFVVLSMYLCDCRQKAAPRPQSRQEAVGANVREVQGEMPVRDG